MSRRNHRRDQEEYQDQEVSWHKGYRTEAPKYRPVAVVDIGSNSVRLVVYDGLRRSRHRFSTRRSSAVSAAGGDQGAARRGGNCPRPGSAQAVQGNRPPDRSPPGLCRSHGGGPRSFERRSFHRQGRTGPGLQHRCPHGQGGGALRRARCHGGHTRGRWHCWRSRGWLA